VETPVVRNEDKTNTGTNIVQYSIFASMERENKYYAYIVGSALVFAIMVIAAITGCNTERKLSNRVINRLDKTELKYLQKSDIDTGVKHWVATRHPVKIGAGKTVYIPGKKEVKHDTFTVYQQGGKDTIIKTVTIKQYTKVHDTVLIKDTVMSSAESDLLRSQLSTTQAAYNALNLRYENLKGQLQAKGGSGKLKGFLWLIVLILATATGIYLYFKPKR